MKKVFILMIVTCSFFAAKSISQPTQEWARIYDGPDHLNDFANDMALDTFGNIYVTGEIHTLTQNSNFGTIKYNSAGVLQWQVFYNGPGSNSIDNAIAIATDKTGNVFVTGYSERGGFGSDDYATIKYNSSGTQLWVSRYNPMNGVNDPRAICVDDSGFIYVTGVSSGIGTGDDYATIKYNQNGDSVWVRRYNGPGNSSDTPFGITTDKYGNVFVTGVSGFDILTIKYNAIGSVMWTARYSRGFGLGRKIVVDNNGFVYVTGNTSTPSTSDDYTTVKYDSMGVQQWLKIYNGPSNGVDDSFDLKVDKNGNIYVTGSSVLNNHFDYLTIKYNSNGDSLWVRRYNGTGNNEDEARGLDLDSLSNVYITGRSFNNNSNLDITTVKYDTNGFQQWVVRYPGEGLKLAGYKNQYLYVLGINGENGTEDFVTLKYSSLTSVFVSSTNIPNNPYLFQNFPNPFNPNTKIRFQIPRFEHVNVSVYDLIGKEITVLINDNFEPGTYEVMMNAIKLPSGVYFYKIITKDYSETKKMILIK